MIVRNIFTMLMALLMVAGAATAALPDLTVELGQKNTGVGLSVANGGDGQNNAGLIKGVSMRRMDDKSGYLYVIVDHPEYKKGPVDVYVTIEFYDDSPGLLTLQYDKAAPESNLATRYTGAGESVLMAGIEQWRKAHFCLPALRLGHGQNHGADFRLAGSRVAVGRISVTTQRPAGYDPDQTLQADVLRGFEVTRPPGMELTYGNDATPAQAALFKALSVTSVESYVDWAGVEPMEGQWDWSKWDKQVAVLQKAGLKWVPFLMAGCAYATPLWFQNGTNTHFYRCLEHGKESRVQSLFNPRLRPKIERFLQAFASRYRDSGVIESVLLGITGIYGESIYPAGPEGGWTARLTGDYHNHFGWWAGDSLAVAAFRDAMKKRYGTMEALNKAWGTSYASIDSVTTFLPEKAPNDRARADFVEWYQQAMTDWAVFWVKATRKAFPSTEIYLCTGGDGNPALGADFTAQTAAVAGEGAGVRITNEGSDYVHNWGMTREVATATRHYGTFCGFEPASSVDSNGVVARIYNATASGARQLHDYTPNTLGHMGAPLRNFRANASYLVPRKPLIRTALYLSRESWTLDDHSIAATYTLAHSLRDIVDLDFVTRRSAGDGHLGQYQVMVLSESPVLEPKASEAIEKWVNDGGTLIAATRPSQVLGGRLYDQSGWRNRLLSDAAPKGTLIQPVLEGQAPAHWRLSIGGTNDQPWLIGAWNDREKGSQWREVPGATMRWSGSRCGVWLPVTPGYDHVLTLSMVVPKMAVGSNGIQLKINGQPVSPIRAPVKQIFQLPVSAKLLGNSSLARLDFEAVGWKPSGTDPSSQDDRVLGFSLREVAMMRAGADRVPPGKAVIRMELDKNALAAITRQVGKGKTIFLPGLAGDTTLISYVLASVLNNPVDGKLDGIYATETEQGVLWFDKKAARIWLK